MKQRTSIVLAAVALIAIGAAWQFGIRGTPSSQVDIAPGTLVFPGLAANLGKAARIEITSKGKTLVLTPKDGRWGLADREGFPVQADKLRELLTGLTELRITEPRTSDPAQYGRLGVEDPAATGTSNLLRLVATDGKPMIELIVGHRRVRTQGNVPETIFIRRPGEAQSWLAEGRLPVDADPQLWFERDIVNIAAAKVMRVQSTRGDTTLEFAREGDKLVLTAPSEHPKLDDYRVEEVGRGLESLTLTDVQPAARQPGDLLGTSVMTTAEGLTVTAKVFKADKDIWIQLAAAGEGAAKQQAEELSARVTGWTYQVGSWKEKSFVPTLDDLKASDPEPPVAGQPGQTAAPATE